MFAIKDIVAGGIEGIIGPFTDIWKKYLDKEITEEQLKAEVSKVLINALGPMVEAQASVVIAEVKSESWLTRNWRPIVALTAFFSYWYVIIVYPHLHLWLGGNMPENALGFGEAGLENLFWLTAVCVGGYVGGRSLEKITDKITQRWR